MTDVGQPIILRSDDLAVDVGRVVYAWLTAHGHGAGEYHLRASLRLDKDRVPLTTIELDLFPNDAGANADA